jgi:hypothetical protein
MGSSARRMERWAFAHEPKTLAPNSGISQSHVLKASPKINPLRAFFPVGHEGQSGTRISRMDSLRTGNDSRPTAESPTHKPTRAKVNQTKKNAKPEEALAFKIFELNDHCGREGSPLILLIHNVSKDQRRNDSCVRLDDVARCVDGEFAPRDLLVRDRA